MSENIPNQSSVDQEKRDRVRIISDFLAGIDATASAGRLWGEEGKDIALAYRSRLEAVERCIPEFEALGFTVKLDTTNKTTNRYQFPRIIITLERGGKSFVLKTRTDENLPTDSVEEMPETTKETIIYIEGILKGAKYFAESGK